MGTVVDASRDSFDGLIATGLVLVDVWSETCRPCVALAPRVAEIAAANPALAVVKLDASKARRVCMAHQVRGLPTFLLFRDGQEVARLTDPDLRPHQLDEWLAAELTAAGPTGEDD